MTSKIEKEIEAVNALDFDDKVQPGDDFFGYVSGKWLDANEIPSDKSSIGSFIVLDDKSQIDVREIIEDSTYQNEKFKRLYDSYMDTETLENAGSAPIKPDIAKIFGATNADELAKVAGELSVYAGTEIFDCGVFPDEKNPAINVAHVEQGGLGLPDESYYHKDEYKEHRERYVKYLEQLILLLNTHNITLLDPDETYTDAKQESTEQNFKARRVAEQIFKFETEISKFHRDNVALRDVEKQYNPYTYDELVKLAGDFPFKTSIKAFGATPETFAKTIVGEPEFVEALADLWLKTPLSVLKNYLAVHYVSSVAGSLSAEFFDVNFDFFSRFLSGIKEPRERWKRGVSLVNGSLGEDIGKIYVQRHFSPDTKHAVETLVQNLQDAYRESITNLAWLTDETKKQALKKLDKMTVKIGYPDKWRDYSALEVSPNDLFQNMINVGKFETKRAIDKAGKEVDRTEWYMNPHMVNAYFEPTANEIVFPAAILRSPFFDLHASVAKNFGGIGTVIGHEIGHCFDDQGAMFNEFGMLTNWWTDDDFKNFKALTAKLVDQYNSYSPRNLDDSKHVIGELTLGENIGDLGGVQIALKAMLNVVKPSSEAEKTEVLREFFTQYALSERIKRTKELTELLLGMDPHSPSEFRVNGVLRNVNAFYEAFGVEKGQKLWLDENERITIW